MARAGGGRSIGARIERREDAPLLTGEAAYTADLVGPGAAHAAIRRSRYGHARIESIDTSAASALDGVLGVFTDDDLGDVPGTVPSQIMPPEGPGFDLEVGVIEPRRPMLAEATVRYTGEALAVVVAEDAYTAHEAADLIEVDYDRLEAVTDPVSAAGEGAPRLHADVEDNVPLVWSVGDAAETDAALDGADHVVELSLVNQRLAPNSLEPRTVLAEYRPRRGRLTVTLSSQVPHHHRGMIAGALGLAENTVRVVAPDVGGGFGLKSKYHQAEAIVAWCSMRLGRPVAWQARRSESFATDIHGRGHHSRAAMGLDADGTMRGLRVETHVDLGAYLAKVSPFIATGAYARLLSGLYDIPAIHCRVTGVFTNKSPMDAYRGAGRPEAAYVVERLVNRAATELDLDPVAIRRRNLIDPGAFPFETAVGPVYDSGDYRTALDRALEMADYEGVRDRQAAERRDGVYRGIGIGAYVESAGVAAPETAVVRVHPEGSVTLVCGTHDHGQGHTTTYSQVLADELGVAVDDVEVREGDTEATPKGTGTYGSRSAIAAGSAIIESARKVVESARAIAAYRLEAAVEDVEFADGAFSVAGAPDRSIGLVEVAETAYTDADLPSDIEPGLEATSFVRPDQTFPFGVHVAVVAVDVETGDVDLERFVAVDDCGVRINPMIVDGQLHGGIAQGLGQALSEGVVYDDAGTLLTGSMLDYALPRAHRLPEFELGETVTPSPNNPLGVKGIGESGSIGPPPAVVNATLDALAPLGVDHLEMPLASEAVWRAIESAGD